MARLHGVTSLLWVGLEGVDIPAPAAAGIRAEFQRSAAASLMFAREFVRVYDALRREGIPVLALKGPALAARAFGKLSMRQCRDLDLLVRPAEMNRAERVLRGFGYRAVSIFSGRTPEDEKHISLMREDNGIRAELHWAVSNPSFAFEIPFDDVWKRRESVSVLGARVEAPRPEDLLLMLSVHGAGHCWTSLKWVCDIAALVRRCPEMDWPALLKRARDAGGLRMVLLALALAEDVAGAGLPPAVWDRVAADPVARRLSREIRTRMFAVDGRLENERRALLYIRTRERLRDRARIASAYLAPKLRPTERERALIALPGFLRFLYWPVRLARLFLMYSAEIGRPLLSGVLCRR